MLPTAQVSNTELEEIVKIRQAGKNAKALVEGINDPNKQLRGGYDNLERDKVA